MFTFPQTNINYWIWRCNCSVLIMFWSISVLPVDVVDVTGYRGSKASYQGHQQVDLNTHTHTRHFFCNLSWNMCTNVSRLHTWVSSTIILAPPPIQTHRHDSVKKKIALKSRTYHKAKWAEHPFPLLVYFHMTFWIWATTPWKQVTWSAPDRWRGGA